MWGPVCGYGSGTDCAFYGPGGRAPTAFHVDEADPYPVDGGGSFPSDLAQISASRMMDRTLADNPFRDATWVIVPYCTGDLHAGATTRDYAFNIDAGDPPLTKTFHFAGGSNMDLFVSRWKAELPAVRRIWLMGSSAGGFGATLNFDRVASAFPGADVALLSDSGPFLPSQHAPQMISEWKMPLPPSCTACSGDGGLPAYFDDLVARHGSARMALLSSDRDRVISFYFFTDLDVVSLLWPYPTPYEDAFNAALTHLMDDDDTRPNAHYFVIEGETHVLFDGYGSHLPDGGLTAVTPSRDGGTDLHAWINAWALGVDGGWPSLR
jgi:hypothetical protein